MQKAYIIITFYASSHLSAKRQQRLNASGQKINRWAFLMLFVVATTPIPDDPVVIPLGLTKDSPYKFFTAYFMGKLIITISGAFIGAWTGEILSEWLTPEVTIVVAVISTIAVTVILLKFDLGELMENITKKLKK